LTNAALNVGDMAIQLKESNVDDEQRKKLENKLGVTVIWVFFVGVAISIGQIIYLIIALGIDVNKYPSVIMLVINILGYIINLVKSKNKSSNNGKAGYKMAVTNLYNSKWSFSRILNNLIYVCYFCYMLYTLL
jgi:hypothetical protein